MSQLKMLRNTAQSFKIDMDDKELANLLWMSYNSEVSLRGREFKPDEELKKAIIATANTLKGASKRGIMYSGTCGNGKTTMVKAIQGAINFLQGERMISKDYGLPIYNARDLVELLTDNKANKSIINAPLIAIDDLGIEPTEKQSYGNTFSPIVNLLEKRYDKMLFTIITTNLTPPEIRAKYGDRIADRFNEMLTVIIFTNKSYRSK